MNSKSEYKKSKQIRLTYGQLIYVQTYFNFRLYITYEKMDKNYDSQAEKFRALICNAEIIDGFTQKDYIRLKIDDLEIIASEILADRKLTKKSGDNIFIDIFVEINKEIEKLKELRESLDQTFISFQEKMFEIIKPFQELSKKICELYNPIAAQIQSITEKWSKTVNEFLEEYKEYIDVKEKASLIASKYDWFISYDFYVGKEFFELLVQLDETESDCNNIDDLFIEYYGGDIRKQIIREIIETEVTKEYENILNQIEYGYDQELFYLVIPAMFTLIEGIIARGFKHKGRMNGTQLKEYINELLDTGKVNSLQEVINKRMLVSFEHGKTVDSPISRHAILHGGDINFGTEAVALRLLLILYNLVFVISLRDVMKEQ